MVILMVANAKPGVQERILLHLLDYSDYKNSVEVPFALSQMGIANAVAIARSNVPRAIACPVQAAITGLGNDKILDKSLKPLDVIL